MRQTKLTTIACTDCGEPTKCDIEVAAVICGTCVQRRCGGEKRRSMAELAVFDKDYLKAFRAEKGWGQAELALAAKCPVEHVRVVEQERGPVSTELGEYLAKRGGQSC